MAAVRKYLCILKGKMNSVEKEKLKFLKIEGSLKAKVLAASGRICYRVNSVALMR